MVLREGVRLGDWRLVERLGTGAFSEVWRAVHAVLGHEAALKIAHGEEAIERLVAGARAQFGLEHPGIVAVRDIVVSERPAWIVMDAVRGPTLRRVLEERGRLEVPCAAAVLRQVMDALEHAHARGIVHGDLKPENILVEIEPGAGRGAQWRVRVTDFLIGRPGAQRAPAPGGALRPSLRTREGVGTLHYMAPEQERPGGAPLDARVDLYALGVLLFEMLTGSLPQGRDLPSDLNPAVSWWWDHVYSRCYTGRERRYPSIEALRADLDAIAGGPTWGELPSQRRPWPARPAAPVLAASRGRRSARGGRTRQLSCAHRRAVRRRRVHTVIGLLLLGGALAVGMRQIDALVRAPWRASPWRVQPVARPVAAGAHGRLVRAWNKGRYRVHVLEYDGQRWVYVYPREGNEPVRVLRVNRPGFVRSGVCGR
ncbi:MAG: serine/threonine protein kinase [Planctomycetota bacterium]|nr:MAG: serine/threonine protein kinase [Planctomycetota bacterium]